MAPPPCGPAPMPFVDVFPNTPDRKAHLFPAELDATTPMGLYAFQRQALADFSNWPPSPLELCESLEQLRALEHGARIVVAETSNITLAVDNPEDMHAVEERLRALLAAEER